MESDSGVCWHRWVCLHSGIDTKEFYMTPQSQTLYIKLNTTEFDSAVSMAPHNSLSLIKNCLRP